MDWNFSKWASHHAVANPERVAIVDSATGRRVTYAEFERRTDALASSLVELGLRPGDRAAMLMRNSAEALEIFFAVAKVGAVSVPVNFRLSASEVAELLVDCSPSVLFFHDDFAAHVDHVASLDRTRGLTLIGVGPTAREDARDYEQLASAPATGFIPAVAGEDDVAFIVYTSGTTGRAKGVMLTHANTYWGVATYQTVSHGLSKYDASMVATPMFHTGGLFVYSLPMLYLGGKVVTTPSWDPSRAVELIEEEQVTVNFLVPSMWAEVLSVVGDQGRSRLSSLRYTLIGGAPCPAYVLEFFQDQGLAFLEGFGTTETLLITMLSEEDVVTRRGTVGRAQGPMEIRIVDEQGASLPSGEVGEVAVRGPSVFKGYWGMPEQTRRAFRDGWYCTGDLGRIDEEGYVTLVDRKNDMIITGGENVYPAEVEQVIVRHPAVREVAVIGRPDERWGERVVAVVVIEGSAAVDGVDLIGWTRERIAHYKAPREIVVVEEMPRNATGKILKRTLRQTLDGPVDSARPPLAQGAMS